MILTTDDMGDLHLNVIDDIHEMEDPGTIVTTECDIGMGAGICEIKFNPSTDLVVQDNLLPGRAKTNRSIVLVEVPCFFQASGAISFLAVRT